MGKIYNRLEEVLIEIVEEETKFLNHELMMGIFNKLKNKISPFKEYIIHLFRLKLNPTMRRIGVKKTEYD